MWGYNVAGRATSRDGCYEFGYCFSMITLSFDKYIINSKDKDSCVLSYLSPSLNVSLKQVVRVTVFHLQKEESQSIMSFEMGFFQHQSSMVLINSDWTYWARWRQNQMGAGMHRELITPHWSLSPAAVCLCRPAHWPGLSMQAVLHNST